MFLEIQEILESNNTTINDLTFYMSSALDYTETGHGGMAEAVEAQKNVRRIKCCIIS